MLRLADEQLRRWQAAGKTAAEIDAAAPVLPDGTRSIDWNSEGARRIRGLAPLGMPSVVSNPAQKQLESERPSPLALIQLREPICDLCPHEFIVDGKKKCAIQQARSPLKAGDLLHPLGLGNPDAQCPDSPPRWRRINLPIVN